jgi:murein DD-endopeptidase MepM/ murein hydrolase activator NlpD
MMRFFVFTLGLFLTQQSQAIDDFRVPGGVAIIPIPSNTDPKFNNRPVLTIRTNDQDYAIVGLGLATKPGEHQLVLPNQRISFVIKGKRYLEQRIYLKNKRQVNPNSMDLDRIKSESLRQRTALNDYSGSVDSVRLILPVEGPVSSPFGKRRFFNDQPRRPHSGTDIAAPKGTPLKAAASGKVVLVGDFFFNGRLVVLDHGEGLKTMYNHMDQIHVDEGELIDQGAIIGTVGATGRVTGAHLHFGVILNGVSVNPALFVPEIRTLPQ